MSQISDYEYEDLIKKLEMDVVSGDIQSMKWLGDVYYHLFTTSFGLSIYCYPPFY